MEELANRLASSVRDLRQIHVESVLEAQILSHLVTGRRTIPELIELLYGVGHENPNHNSYYMKVRRSLQGLSARGYVSCPLFGKNRAYRLTQHAVANLANIGGEERDRIVRLVPLRDVFLYAFTTTIGAVSFSMGVDVGFEAWMYLVFAFLLGVSTNNGVRTLLRVS
jgi:hypothetical protein